MFELIGEFFNPGPMGIVEVTAERPPVNPKWLWVRLALALHLIGLTTYRFAETFLR